MHEDKITTQIQQMEVVCIQNVPDCMFVYHCLIIDISNGKKVFFEWLCLRFHYAFVPIFQRFLICDCLNERYFHGYLFE